MAAAYAINRGNSGLVSTETLTTHFRKQLEYSGVTHAIIVCKLFTTPMPTNWDSAYGPSMGYPADFLGVLGHMKLGSQTGGREHNYLRQYTYAHMYCR
jgi:hypothetical protein